jgi:S-adenosylmethionine-diacylgycerolhomoserine-N-methlytransferase
MSRTYRAQAGIFDVTRAPILLGRSRLAETIDTATNVLEVGCGTGRNLAGLRRAVGTEGRVFGLECATAMLRRARRRAPPGVEVLDAEYGVDPLPAGIAPLDAIVFSYSLSMIPDFDLALAQAHRDLRVGGRLIVLDFADAPSRVMRAWMASFGVALGAARFDAIASRFSVIQRERRRAWLGLWSYQMCIAERVAPNP